MSDRTEKFLNLYSELEQFAAKEYSIDKTDSAFHYMCNRPEFSRIRDELDYCREVRNLLVHKKYMSNVYKIEPSETLIHVLENTLEKVKNPPRVSSLAIPIGKVATCTISDYVLPAMRMMNEKNFTHIPIVDNGIVVGVFSENTVFSYITDEEIVEIDKDTKFEKLSKYLPINCHRAEVFRFVKKDALTYDISQLFSKALNDGERIGMLFVTEHGKSSEKLLGIVTAWDVAGADL